MYPGFIFNFTFQKKSFPAWHPSPTPNGFQWKKLEGALITSRFPLAFRRILWVTTTEERAKKGMIRHRCPGGPSKSRVQGGGAPEPRVVQASLKHTDQRGVKAPPAYHTPQDQRIHQRGWTR